MHRSPFNCHLKLDMSTNVIKRKLASFQLSSDARQATYVIICIDLISIVI